ncbi:recombinase family protein [Streptomyces sp. NPDC001381]|uniref:recombinase family protein n=1 Tax=Streptomyces sp. NPDC001381 TaxID=3364567 RepID=UPI00368E82F2
MTRTEANGQGKVDGDAAVYCRISQAGDDDQTGVDRQERICREVAERLGLRVADVFVDNNRSAWKRNRKRPGWEALLQQMAEGAYGHVIVYHPDRLMRQPKDLEELLTIADDQRVVLHGQANRKDLSDPDDRFILRIEVAHACRSSDDTSRRVVSALEDRRRAGQPHGGRRRFGYGPDGRTIVEAEAEIVREVFRRFLDGESPSAIAKELHGRRLKTAEGASWEVHTVRKLLASTHVAGLQRHKGERAGIGDWPAIIDVGQWEEVQQMRAYRSVQHRAGRRGRFYLLRGVVTCTCGTRMAGATSGDGRPYYQCTRAQRNGRRCGNTISAEPLEEFAKDVALRVLANLDITGRPPAATARPEADVQADEDDAAQLAELNEMWLAKEIPTAEYRAMRRRIEDRMKDRQRRTVQRPVAVLEGIAGPDAQESWRKLEEEKEHARMNAIFRFLFAAVIIHPARRRGPGVDFDRIDIEPNPLD